MVQLTPSTKLLSLIGLSSFVMVSAGGGMIAQVVDSTNFCVFLPPPGQMSAPLSDNEWDSQAYCLGSTPQATNANTLPDGFIQSAHYVATDSYVQVTGQIDPSKVGLNPTDEGGQCDIMAPKGSSCAGWQYYVNLIEPAGNTYCMRCCNDPVNCNRGISQDGCARVVPGDYSGPMDGTGSGTSSPSASSSVSSASASASSSSSQPSSSVTIVSSSALPSSSSSSTLSSSSSSSSSSIPSPSNGSTSNTGTNGNGSASGQLGQSSVIAQSVNQGSSMNVISTRSAVVTGGLIALISIMLTP
ncbi:uncharacterized protein BX664DRAFT_383518 [Halteromyces radiatus]|uniref:uncharacterized protein n=1 Tax=Halteromyces radiatus TaxID=101107 RepID=UPI002220032E|nr:uncharacterized protein BX664DRAFT_383518 [Halteromyces radiatus]KAI8097206.1 hypothetical protein BX664DRAFT_383518 [Halteromyces radiatus]